MKFVCLGYIDQAKWETMTAPQRAAYSEECAAYHDELRRGGHLLADQGLQGAASAVTLRAPHGKAVLVEGALAPSTQPLAQILFLAARDLNSAVQLLSKHPVARAGAFEIRLADTGVSAPVAIG